MRCKIFISLFLFTLINLSLCSNVLAADNALSPQEIRRTEQSIQKETYSNDSIPVPDSLQKNDDERTSVKILKYATITYAAIAGAVLVGAIVVVLGIWSHASK